ncbi:serine-rich adhesin for platelets-like [Macrobrachium nipponense]|uniref:serine-rich adhesin for platelets-like n=1 Tax=Macrobrachium nipponense TaxID=159736 RepID=UPI0030C8C866
MASSSTSSSSPSPFTSVFPSIPNVSLHSLSTSSTSHVPPHSSLLGHALASSTTSQQVPPGGSFPEGSRSEVPRSEAESSANRQLGISDLVGVSHSLNTAVSANLVGGASYCPSSSAGVPIGIPGMSSPFFSYPSMSFPNFSQGAGVSFSKGYGVGACLVGVTGTEIPSSNSYVNATAGDSSGIKTAAVVPRPNRTLGGMIGTGIAATPVLGTGMVRSGTSDLALGASSSALVGSPVVRNLGNVVGVAASEFSGVGSGYLGRLNSGVSTSVPLQSSLGRSAAPYAPISSSGLQDKTIHADFSHQGGSTSGRLASGSEQLQCNNSTSCVVSLRRKGSGTTGYG